MTTSSGSASGASTINPSVITHVPGTVSNRRVNGRFIGEPPPDESGFDGSATGTLRSLNPAHENRAYPGLVTARLVIRCRNVSIPPP